MIDGRDSQYTPESNAPPLWAPPARSDSAERSGSDLYDDLFTESAGNQQPPAGANVDGRSATPTPVVPENHSPAKMHGERAVAPTCPIRLADTGLPLMLMCELVLKQLYLQGNLLGVQIARAARVPFRVVEEALRFLKDEKCIEVASGDLLGPASYRFNLTELGRKRAREAFEQCRYVGPAPVPLEDYVAQCRRQTVANTVCTAEALQQSFDDLIIRPGLLQELGPAVCSGRSIFLYGPPGNGKTAIAKGLGRFLNTFGGEMYVPYAILAESSIITVFDPTIHQPTDNAEELSTDVLSEAGENGETNWTGDLPDYRWRKVRRPVVITGGELTLEMLDLRYNATSNFYSAPLHIKANSGVFLIDDFGRQIVSPRDLLNRWILPLEERIDFLTLATGKKFAVPFEQLIIFSTNLDPRELVDEAFLRRIRHKIHIGPPERDLYTEIFRLCCNQREIAYQPSAIDFLYANYYDHGKLPRASDPRDLLEIVQSVCRFRNQAVALNSEMMEEATKRFFVKV